MTFRSGSRGVVSRIKIMARMDIAEKRLPQDGRIGVRVGGRSLDLRVSTVPPITGRKWSSGSSTRSTRTSLWNRSGFPRELSRMEEIISRPQGIVLITGPTGSGKTTTLYGILNRIKSVEDNITTIEDRSSTSLGDQPGGGAGEDRPQLRRHAPGDAAAGPRRHHAGRDARPGYDSIAVQAALTGHLVLSTIHTNSSVATITRLRDLGVPPSCSPPRSSESWRSAWSARSARNAG